MSSIAPGWYKDPAEPATQRYWDGEGWIGDPLPVDATPPPGPPPVAPPVPEPPTAGTPVPPGAPGQPGDQAPPGTPVPPGGRVPLPQPPGWGPPPPGWRPGMPLPPGFGLPPGQQPGTAAPQGYPYVLVQQRPHGLPVAPLGLRFLARLIDIVVVTALNVIGNGWFIYLLVKDLRPFFSVLWHQVQTGAASDLPTPPARANTLSWVIVFIAMALWWAYEVPGIAHTGQTFGKRLVGIKVMPLESEQPIGWVRAFRRWVPLGVPMAMWWFCGLGLLLQFIDSLSPVLGGPLQMAMHDRSALTVVVHSGRRGHEKVPEQTTADTEGQT